MATENTESTDKLKSCGLVTTHAFVPSPLGGEGQGEGVSSYNKPARAFRGHKKTLP